MTMTLERSSSSSLTRASSNLELLSQTAAWKNAVENPARVSPAEHSTKTNPVLSPKSNGSCVIADVGLRSPVYSSSSTTTRTVPKVVTSSPREWTEDWGMIQMSASSESGETSGGAVSQTGTLNHQQNPVLPLGSSFSAVTGSTGTTTTSSTGSASFLPPALASSMGIAMPTDFSSVHSLFRRDSSSSEDTPAAQAATTPTTLNNSRSNSPGEPAASGLAARQAQRPSFTLNPRSRGTAFVETTSTTTATLTPPGILHTSSSVSWTGVDGQGEISSSARTSSSTDLTVIDELARDNALLRHEVNQKNLQIQAMQERMDKLEAQVAEFKQMPVGKISQIPVSDMLELMQTYGSEVSEHTQLPSSLHPNGKRTVQRASIVRQFRRWNPNFTEHFEFRCGKWVPKLGIQGELERRAQNRAKRRSQKAASIHKKKQNNGNSNSTSKNSS